MASPLPQFSPHEKPSDCESAVRVCDIVSPPAGRKRKVPWGKAHNFTYKKNKQLKCCADFNCSNLHAVYKVVHATAGVVVVAAAAADDDD